MEFGLGVDGALPHCTGTRVAKQAVYDSGLEARDAGRPRRSLLLGVGSGPSKSSSTTTGLCPAPPVLARVRGGPRTTSLPPRHGREPVCPCTTPALAEEAGRARRGRGGRLDVGIGGCGTPAGLTGPSQSVARRQPGPRPRRIASSPHSWGARALRLPGRFHSAERPFSVRPSSAPSSASHRLHRRPTRGTASLSAAGSACPPLTSRAGSPSSRPANRLRFGENQAARAGRSKKRRMAEIEELRAGPGMRPSSTSRRTTTKARCGPPSAFMGLSRGCRRWRSDPREARCPGPRSTARLLRLAPPSPNYLDERLWPLIARPGRGQGTACRSIAEATGYGRVSPGAGAAGAVSSPANTTPPPPIKQNGRIRMAAPSFRGKKVAPSSRLVLPLLP